MSAHTSPSLKSTYRSTVPSVNASAKGAYSRRLSNPSNEHTANTRLMTPSEPRLAASAAAVAAADR